VANIRVAANAVGRIAARGARNSRVLRAGYTAAETTVRTFARVLHLLFLQVAGLLFCLFGLGIAARIPRAYQERTASTQGPGQLYLLVVMSALFLWFGVTSFWRSRRK
jgi:uncharacterized membrane protein